MKKRYFLFACMSFMTLCHLPCFGKESIILRSKPYGMFSLFHFVLYFLQEYERQSIDGLRVDFEKTGLYYDEEKGLNWWEYYFEPIAIGNLSTLTPTIIEENTHIDPNSIEFANTLEQNYALIEKYIQVKKHILEKVETFQNVHFKDKYVIGLHYRGTDKVYYEAPRVSYKKALEQVQKQINDLPEGKDYQIFIATDEIYFLNYIKSQFKDKVCFSPSKRSSEGIPLHLDPSRNPYQTGEDALIDALLLSKSSVLIRTSSNLSLCSRYFSPKMPAIELSTRNLETYPCTSF